MPEYSPPIDEMRFLLAEVFDFDQAMDRLFPEHGFDCDLALTVLDEAGRFCSDVLQPLNRSADEEGCRLENGTVVTAKGFAQAYATFVEAGWGGLSGDITFGGQGLPRAIQLLVDEMVSASNMAFGLFPGLTRGAAEALTQHADERLKRTYLPKMISGHWTGAMALTEASAGTDLGLLKTKARPNGDGSYSLTGTKIFISSGDHDFGGNIIHLVLARLPDAPDGVKGISLFLAPKYLVDCDGGLGVRNTFSVGSLEQKMGIHAQPTCLMNYDGAQAWLIGEPHRGLNAMFTMMNAERLFVGIQALGIANAAHQKATGYAKERLQGRSADGAREPAPIIDHPDVRRMLATTRVFVEAGRALAVWTALQIDTAAHDPDSETQQRAGGIVALLTPVIKAAFTDFGFESAVLSQQVFGGHGFIREWGMEQFVRDARITQIYEGTNGAQAVDLVTRKLLLENGDLPHRFIALIKDDLEAADRIHGAKAIVGAVTAALGRLRTTTQHLQALGGDAAETGAAASDYLRLFALVCLGWMWVKMTAAALTAGDDATSFHNSKVAASRFFSDKILPQSIGLADGIMNGGASLKELGPATF